jgi:hypothetical protein
LDGHDLFGEMDYQNNGFEVQEHVPSKHENGYVECDIKNFSEQCISEFDLDLLNTCMTKPEEIQYSMPMNYQVKMETVSDTIVLSLMHNQLNIVLYFIVNRKGFMLVIMLSTHIGRCQRMFQY